MLMEHSDPMPFLTPLRLIMITGWTQKSRFTGRRCLNLWLWATPTTWTTHL